MDLGGSPLRAEALGLIAGEPREEGDQDRVTGWLQRLCRSASKAVGNGGVGLSLVSHTGEQVVLASSDPVSAQIEELQFALAEGPCLESLANRRPVLVPELDGAVGRWPAYTPAAAGYGVRAVFAFPLQVGVAGLGALDVYRWERGSLSPRLLSLTLSFAELALEALLNAQANNEDPDSIVATAEDHHYEVYQAQGMVMIQLEVAADEALARIRAYAFVNEKPMREVAIAILARRLFLEVDAV